MNKQKIEEAIRKLLEGIGENPSDEHLKETPRRVADMFADELIKNEGQPKISIFANKEKYDEMVLQKKIPFHSLCAHHILPFFGEVAVGYIPKDSIIGLGKLSAIVDFYASKLQTQEDMTMQIAKYIESALKPKGVIVVIKARHLCMEMRGIKKAGSTMITSSVKGRFRSDPKTRTEALALIND